MGYQIEELYKDFMDAVELFAEANATIDQGVKQLRAAESRMMSVREHFMEYMGSEEAASSDPSIWDAGNLFKGLSKGSRSFEDFFNLGNLF